MESHLFLPLEDYPYINLTSCTYIPDFEFDTSVPPRAYEIAPEDVKNLLGNCYPCMELYATIGQGIRMRESILSGAYDSAITTLESLYEPYTGIYRTCCWSEIDEDRPPLFQPGFDYEFVYCEDEISPSGGRPEPWPYADLTFNTGDVVYSFDKDIDISDFYKIKHLNGTAVKIKQIDDAQARRCYSNLAKNAVNGNVVKFNDGVINSNYTVSPKDSTQINNPDLIMQLDQGLYLIETNFDDGTQNQNVILKENDNNECP